MKTWKHSLLIAFTVLATSSCSSKDDFYLDIIQKLRDTSQSEARNIISNSFNCWTVSKLIAENYNREEFNKYAIHYNKIVMIGILSRHTQLSDPLIIDYACTSAHNNAKSKIDILSECGIDRNDKNRIEKYNKELSLVDNTYKKNAIIYSSHSISNIINLDTRIELSKENKENLIIEYYSNNC